MQFYCFNSDGQTKLSLPYLENSGRFRSIMLDNTFFVKPILRILTGVYFEFGFHPLPSIKTREKGQSWQKMTNLRNKSPSSFHPPAPLPIILLICSENGEINPRPPSIPPPPLLIFLICPEPFLKSTSLLRLKYTLHIMQFYGFSRTIPPSRSYPLPTYKSPLTRFAPRNPSCDDLPMGSLQFTQLE